MSKKKIENNENTRRHSKMRLPKGFGSVRYLGDGRSKPYAVMAPAERVETPSGWKYRYQKPLCYVRNWTTGVAVLTAWHTGQFRPEMGQEIDRIIDDKSGKPEDVLTRGMLDDFLAKLQDCIAPEMAVKRDAPSPKDGRSITVIEAFERYYENKYGSNASKKLSPLTAQSDRSIAKNLEPLYHRELDSLTVDELQMLVNQQTFGKMMLGKLVTLIRQIYKFALSRELCSKNPAQYLQIPDAKEVVHHEDFTDEEIRILWNHKDDKVVRMMLIMCYSGFRIGEFENIEIHLEEMYFRGGSKTAAGKNRVVPIHSSIQAFAAELKASDKRWLAVKTKDRFSRMIGPKMQALGIDHEGRHHSSHSCRHTFSRLCESYGVNENDRKRMLGHSLKGDITNDVYGHRSIEELRVEIEKIRVEDTGYSGNRDSCEMQR